MNEQQLIDWLEETRLKLICKAESMSNNKITKIEKIGEFAYQATQSMEKQMLIVKSHTLGEVIEKIKKGHVNVLGLDRAESET